MKSTQNSDEFNRKLYVADFETTVEKDPTTQESTEVYMAGLCPVIKRPEPINCRVWNNIFQFIEALSELPDFSIVFFHNLKFDGSFLLNTLNKLGFKPAMSWEDEDHYAKNWQQKFMPMTYRVAVSNMGQWYSIHIRFEDKTIEIRDSAKKIPSELAKIGKDFGTKYQKLTMQYENDENVHHKAFGQYTEEELEYFYGDLLVLAEAMYIVWYDYNMQGITIAADALREYKNIMGAEYDILFPDLSNIYIDDIGGYEHESIHHYCQQAYSGGWCWKNPVNSNVVYKSDIKYSDEIQKQFDKITSKLAHLQRVKNIVVIDVNSLYPSSMISESGNAYPIGFPEYFEGEPKKSQIRKKAIIRRFDCRFKIKKGFLPFIHIRGDVMYNANECLTTSDINGSRYYKSRDGFEHDTLRTYTMTECEFELFKKHYDILDYKPIDYLTFEKRIGIFDKYIEKYKKMKIEAVEEGNPSKKAISKLFLNSLYGKFGSTLCSSFKKVRFEDDVMKFDTITEYEKSPVYMPIAAFVTSYARRFTITAGQYNYFEGEHRGTQYSDTDSLHIVDMNPDELKGVEFHKSDFLKWACEESSCAFATYAKQKTYIEIATEEDFETVTKSKEDKSPWFKVIIKAAGLGKEGKKKFVDGIFLEDNDPNKLHLEDFRPGLKLKNSNLKAKQIKGGVLLVPSEFKLS